ncbi:MAG TPA: exodeoxyribonuclease VII large subunit [Nitrosospira sp.]|nr:exodeoxyribonuclease VII large subunit [Nitrosospira sp.]
MNSQMEMEMPVLHPVLSVSELNRSARELLEQAFPLLWVSGEISNIKCYGSGHWYFSLKDAQSQVRCVMFREKNRYLDWQPKDGMQVEARALVTLYQVRGEFQLCVETLRRAGLGRLYEAFEQLRGRLEKEGLFAPGRKKRLPSFPAQIGVITSPAGAALHDVLSTLKRRMPSIPVVVYPVAVQGFGAAEGIAAAIQRAEIHAQCDVLILCRGGGSIEDLWAFNEEVVARAIAACAIPLVSGVGHETDFTIADFVADVRAPTPTGASQLVCPDREELLRNVAVLWSRACRGIRGQIGGMMQSADRLGSRLVHPGKAIRDQLARLQYLHNRLDTCSAQRLENLSWRLRELGHRLALAAPDIHLLAGRLHELELRLHGAAFRRMEILMMELQRQRENLAHLNPRSVLERGYSITYAPDGTVVRNSGQISIGEVVRVEFATGWSEALIEKKDQ